MKSEATANAQPSHPPTLEERLHRASVLNDVAAVKELLATGAKPNAANKGGSTSLRIALINRFGELADLLRNYGGTVLCVRTVFDDAAEGALDRLKQAIGEDQSVLGAIDHDAWTLLHWAAAGGAAEVVAWLLEQRVDAGAKTRQDETPLHMASTPDNLEVAELLIRHGADVNAPTLDGTTPLHAAARDGAARVAHALLAHGAAVDAGINEGWTPLHCTAAYRTGLAVAKVLLDGGSDINAPGCHGETPLHCAVGWGNIDIVELLLVRGADVTLLNNDGKTALDEAIKYNRPHIARLLSTYLDRNEQGVV